MSSDDGELSVHRGFRVGEWLVQPSLNRLTRGSETVTLEPRAMDLLTFLARHAGKVVSRETIIDAVWAEQYVGEGVLRQAIAALRSALGDDAKNPTYIETISKRGYRLIIEPVPAWHDAGPAEEGEDPLAASARTAPRIGATLSRYKIVEKLGEGGMGVVYRARDTALDRDVAVKVLAERVAGDQERVARFEREAKAIAKLSHPNILYIHDFGTEGGVTFAATELLEGETLRQALDRDGSLAVERALAIARGVAAGLAAAHSKGIIHRDIKPGNIFLTEEGGVKILDFGLARSDSETVTDILVPPEGERGLTTPGVILGTVGYMSPEQARGQPATPASDVFSLGCVLYEMLIGVGPFKRHTDTDTLSAILKEPPPPMDVAEQEVARELQRVVWKALEKDPAERYASGAELKQALAEVEEQLAPPPPVAVRSLVKWLTRPRVLIPALIVVAVVGVVLGRWLHHQSKVSWARRTAIPEIARLIEAGEGFDAFTLAEEAKRYVDSDPVLDGLFDQVCGLNTIVTDPPGATVAYKGYSDVDGAWTELGETPLQDVRLPQAWLRFRIEKDGYRTREVARHPFRSDIAAEALEEASEMGLGYADDSSFSFTFTLDVEGKTPEGMVAVDPGTYSEIQLSAFPRFASVDLDRYLIDRTEVTNREFKEFLDAGGYQRPEFWKEEFVKEGRALSFEEAMGLFRDTTDRPGPATWELEDYDHDQASHPVSGVSWYEAAAYCEFRGKSLPTIYHWARAALPSAQITEPLYRFITALSNYGGEGPAPVASFPGIGISGAYDLAGNVREWCWSAAEEQRFVLGGAWSDPTYKLTNAYYQPPLNRSPLNGFRCAVYPDGEPDPTVMAPLSLPPTPDFHSVPSLSDREFQMAKTVAYSYDRVPLNAVLDSQLQLDSGGREEWVSVDTAYGKERLPIRLQLPSDGEPPYQAVVFFPGMYVMYEASVKDGYEPLAASYDFIVKSGRAFVLPIYAGAWERNDGRTIQRFRSPNSARELFIQWFKDIGRTLDYLEEREEIDAARVAFAGFSLGAQPVARNLLALEGRFRAALLWSGGFNSAMSPAIVTTEVQATRRITTPVLMINGCYDYRLPVETHQKSFFDLLGTPPEHKRHVVFEAGHWPFPRAEFIRENLAWLDKYLGPVERAVP
jgi:DNA-binding winged helix-turn-helix (wHTH) protein/dienelactone hydrolase